MSVSVSTEGMAWMSFGSMAMERSRLPTVNPARLEKLLGISPSPPHPAAMEIGMALGLAHPADMENDMNDLMEEDVWGDESSSNAEEAMASVLHSSHIKRWRGSDGNSGFSALLDVGSNGSSTSRAAGNFLPLQFSSSMMSTQEVMQHEGRWSESQIMPHPVASGGMDNIKSTSPGYGIMSPDMSITPGYGPRSAPMMVPLWSKLCSMTEHTENHVDDDGDGEERLPPHELLAKQHARNQISTFSVVEGAGRTLKGRDMSLVRDAVWKQTGFFG